MTPAAERYARAQELFEAAVDLPAEERPPLLDRLCNGDEALRREIEALLAADAQSDGFGEEPAFVIPPDIFNESVEEPTFAGRHFGPYEIVREPGRGALGADYFAVTANTARKWLSS